MAQPVNLQIDIRILLNIGIRTRDICLGLVIIVVADEILDRILGKELFEFTVQLRGERLVMRDNQRRSLQLFNDIGHREGFAGTGYAEQRLKLVALTEALHQFCNRLRLVAGRCVRRMQMKLAHVLSSLLPRAKSFRRESS